jgi:RHS repeat-associated protein
MIAAGCSLTLALSRFCRTLPCCLLLSSIALAQSSKPTDGSTPLGLAPGSPAGSYSLSGFDTINPYSGGLNFRLPLLRVGGRGGAAHTVMLPIEQKWQVETYTVQSDDATETHHYPDNDWWGVTGPGYGIGVMHVRHAGGQLRLKCGAAEYNRQTVTRLTFTAADGTEFELRDQLTGGQVILNTSCASPAGHNRGRVFSTVDGTSATFVADADISDIRAFGSTTHQNVSGYLMSKDGTRYRVDGGVVTSVRDKNGNLLTFDGQTITDPLNRQVSIAYNVSEAGYGTCDKLTYKGFGGAQRTVRVCKTSLANALRSGYALQTPAALFPGLEGSSYANFNPTVVSAVWLPDGDGVTRRYELRYNSYAELAWVKLPTGGVIEYDHAGGLDGSPYNGGVVAGSSAPGIYRRVVERRERADGVNLSRRTTYSRPETSPACCSISTAGYVTVDEFDASGVRLARGRHYFHGGGAASTIMVFNGLVSSAHTTEGREYKSEAFAANGTTELRRVQHTWQQGSAFGQGPFVSETTTTLVDANLVAKQTFSYDQYNNRTDVYDYGYGAGAPGALVRRAHTDYLTVHPTNAANYATNNDIHIRNLPTQVWLSSDAAGLNRLGLSTYEYDNYSNTGNYAPLSPRTNITGHDASFGAAYVTRGNAVRVTKYADAAAQGGAANTYAQFDTAGNVVKSIDARNYAATFDFTDRFGSPDGEARANAQPAELGSQATYAFATSSTNPLGHTGYTQYDYYLGKPVEAEDPNGVIYSGYYDDALDRPTQLISARGLAATQAQTTFDYDDAARLVTTTSDRAAYGDNLLKSQSLYDQMGRAYETRQYESASNYSAVRRLYDALGRAEQVSNPFRPWQGETPVWTTKQFDALGRTALVTLPDGAQVVTSYFGNQTTVTDPAGKSRRVVTDALGRTAQVVEDPSGLAYQTTYTHDALGNLRKVDQGGQLRYFLYDSLSRLLRVRLPEQAANAALALTDPVTGNSQWSAGYSYDAGGNLLSKTDARGVSIGYQYDALSRNTTVDYSNTAAVNPDVSRFYDNPAAGKYGKGRFWHDYAGGDFVAGLTVEHEAVDAYDPLGRPLVKRQHFKTNGAWSPAYQTQQVYNRAGSVTTLTYPSGRSVNQTQFDGAGRLQAMTGNLGDGVTRTYAGGIEYDASGQLRQEQFGTNVPLYDKRHYNVRGQLYDVRLSTQPWQTSEWDWNRGAVSLYYGGYGFGQSGPANSGNITQANHWVPADDQLTTHNFTQQSFQYDALNRLSSVTEAPGTNWTAGAPTGVQSYAYDRWGNRQIDAVKTWGANVPEQQVAFNPADNRLGVPAGHGGVIQYDAAGNVTADTYSASAAQRVYDAENRMTLEQNSQTSVFYKYAYDADGRRTRRDVGGSVTWHVYGIGGELLAEYPAGGVPVVPRKEYGYRNGEMLIVSDGVAASPSADVVWVDDSLPAGAQTSAGGFNEAWSWVSVNPGPSSGAVADQSQVGGGLHQQYFEGATQAMTVAAGDNLVAYVYLDPANPPAEIMLQWHAPSGGWEHRAYWGANHINWGTDGTNSRRDMGPRPPLGQWTRLEVPAAAVGLAGQSVHGLAFTLYGGRATWDRAGKTSVPGPRWIVTDHLGSPRMTADKTGSLAGIRRRDYLPFGEELSAGTAGRTAAQGYSTDGLRQGFTGYERDAETGLDFAEARYYSTRQGRFTAVDPLHASAKLTDPQTLNRYAYVGNNPLIYTDPSGMSASPAGGRSIANYTVAGAVEAHSVEGMGDDGGESEQEATQSSAPAALSGRYSDHMVSTDPASNYVVDYNGNPVAQSQSSPLSANWVNPLTRVPGVSPEQLRNDGGGLGHFDAPRRGKPDGHAGIDLRGKLNETPVHAALGGTVQFFGHIKGYGVSVILNHGNGVTSQYSHLQTGSINASGITRKGQSVAQGQQIGIVGNTGNAGGKKITPHVHFEIRAQGRPQDPAGVLNLSSRVRP